jgi:hypothetical protein
VASVRQMTIAASRKAVNRRDNDGQESDGGGQVEERLGDLIQGPRGFMVNGLEGSTNHGKEEDRGRCNQHQRERHGAATKIETIRARLIHMHASLLTVPLADDCRAVRVTCRRRHPWTFSTSHYLLIVLAGRAPPKSPTSNDASGSTTDARQGSRR